jgi:hypothetical protein
MKVMMILLAVVLFVSPQVFAELSVSDLEKIREIVKESETRMKEYVSQEITKVDTKFTDMEKSLAKRFSQVEESFAFQLHMVEEQIEFTSYTILGLIVIGLTLIIFTFLQGRKLRKMTEIYEELKQEIEMLKQERIVRP